MERYFGFDLGDAESAVARLNKDSRSLPEIIPIKDAGNFITAYARLLSGDLLIGESACYNVNAVTRSIRFKSRFLTDPESEKDVKCFQAQEIYHHGPCRLAALHQLGAGDFPA